MEENIKKLFPRLAQIGIVVRDLDKSIEQYEKILGLKPDRVIEKSPTGEGTKYYYGKASDFFQRVALYQLGDVELELLQPFGGDSVLKDFLDQNGEGVHHIAFDTENFGGVCSHFEDNDIPLIQTGPTSRHPALKWGFFDTVKGLGTTLEVFNFLEVAKLEEK